MRKETWIMEVKYKNGRYLKFSYRGTRKKAFKLVCDYNYSEDVLWASMSKECVISWDIKYI